MYVAWILERNFIQENALINFFPWIWHDFYVTLLIMVAFGTINYPWFFLHSLSSRFWWGVSCNNWFLLRLRLLYFHLGMYPSYWLCNLKFVMPSCHVYLEFLFAAVEFVCDRVWPVLFLHVYFMLMTWRIKHDKAWCDENFYSLRIVSDLWKNFS